MPHPLHEQVRRSFAFRCGYCGAREAEVGGELTVDHYQPRAAGGTDALSNLVYSCSRCNQYKGEFWPTSEQLTAGFFVLHPKQDELAKHLQENEFTGELEALTITGDFHLRLLHLNRPQLIAQRMERRAFGLLRQRAELLETQIKQHEQTIQALEEYVRVLLNWLRFGPPQ